MASNNKFVHFNFNAQEVQNVSLEKLAANPGTLYEGRIWYDTSDEHIHISDGTNVIKVANASDLNKFGALIGVVDASAGIPGGTTAGQIGSGVDLAGDALTTAASLQKGDFWIVSVAGTIAGIQGADELVVGDILMCTVDSSTTAADWIGIQMNINDALLGTERVATLSAPLVANTPLSFAAAQAAAVPAITTISSISVVLDATGEDITSGVAVLWTAQTVESNIGIAGVTITVTGN